jgi:23S rRNA pseudouridine1911/1915/1917 synthase
VLNASALVEATLHTGRTHQIRVHLQHLGCPVIGDPVYSDRTARHFQQATHYEAPRQMLHAVSLGFIHPVSGKKLTVESPLPEDFVNAMNFLKPHKKA